MKRIIIFMTVFFLSFNINGSEQNRTWTRIISAACCLGSTAIEMVNFQQGYCPPNNSAEGGFWAACKECTVGPGSCAHSDEAFGTTEMILTAGINVLSTGIFCYSCRGNIQRCCQKVQYWRSPSEIYIGD